ncbi:MAG: L-aspartate oxidase [SAR202 cluster bacterium]|nr:L-aspartate oxidase [SAR202 cluster bacterium]
MRERYDYIVIGSGIAGLFAALAAQEHGSVLLITKGSIEDCNTLFAQGGIAAAVGRDDTADLHLRDTLAAGAGLVDADAARVLTTEGPQRVAELIKMGVAFDAVHGEVALAREGAHSRARVLHAGGDATGAHIETTLASAARDSRVRVLEYALAMSIRTDPRTGAAEGVDVLDIRIGFTVHVAARHIILATGGAGQLFRSTTNPEVATGDGVALAFRAGARLMDMEFYQFHPTALVVPGAPRFLISEAVRGEGGILRNGNGEAFMARYHELRDLAPRDIVARAIVSEMRAANTDHVYLDVTHLPVEVVTTRFPTISHTCRQYSIDITRQSIPVAPAAHYMMGGVRTNLWGETSVPNLYAAGEVTCTGVHGANRLASNSLLETIVFARRVIQRTLGEGGEAGGRGRAEEIVRVTHRDGAAAERPDREALQSLMWNNVGILRDEQRLTSAADRLSAWALVPPHANDRASHEVANMSLVGWLMAEAALRRTESRGAHYRTDHPETRPEWERHLVLVRG